MLEDWKKLRQLKRESERARQRWIEADKGSDPNELEDADFEFQKLSIRVNYYTTKIFQTKALKLGIEIPEKWWWTYREPGEDNPAYDERLLTQMGKAGVKRLIREERRKTIEWWAKTVGGIITLLTGLVGALIGIISVISNRTK